jgi:hypothetical protein
MTFDVSFAKLIKVCFLCDATNGAFQGSLLNSFTNPDGPWTFAPLMQSVPWNTEPAFAKLLFFCLLLSIGIDLMHCWHLGVGRDVCGSAIKYLIQKRGYFPGRNIKQRLRTVAWP